MPRPKNIDIDLIRKMVLMKQARLSVASGDLSVIQKNINTDEDDQDSVPLLSDRIAAILHIVRNKPQKATTVIYLILYDIADHRVRTNVAKYLKKKGCLRIQKSVFMANSNHRTFESICETLREINEIYENKDSIILVPVNVSDVRSMKLIGQNVNIELLTDPPNTLFF